MSMEREEEMEGPASTECLSRSCMEKVDCMLSTAAR